MGDIITRSIAMRNKRRIDALDPRTIYGVAWDKSENPTLTRTDAAVGMEAAVGVDGQSVHNDFDNAGIFRDIYSVEDAYGNAFIRIPKFYIRKTDTLDAKTWQISRYKHPGFYLPWCFWDFRHGEELPYFDYGAHKASLSVDNKLESKPGTYPLVNKTIVQFRDYARANNVADLQGYQQLDIHAIDVLRTLMFIEFATLNIQSVMQGFSSGAYSSSYTATVAENAATRVIVASATADAFRVGQSISIGTSLGNTSVFYGRTITAIEDYNASNKAIVFDGEPVDIAIGNVVWCSGWKSGFSSQIAASSGSIGSNADGKYPCMYRGIESPFADVYQWVDGVNINDNQAWVCRDAARYVSNVFANPYETLAYVNLAENGYPTEMGYDSAHPYAEFPTAIQTAGISTTKYYSDYYYQAAGQRVARFGGYWSHGSDCGLSFWYLYSSAASTNALIGGRLLKKRS